MIQSRKSQVMAPTIVITGMLPILRFTKALAFSNRSGLVNGNSVMASHRNEHGAGRKEHEVQLRTHNTPGPQPPEASITPISAIRVMMRMATIGLFSVG